MKNIALVGGGTLGHVTPNIALVPELKKRGYNVIYIGEKNGAEEESVLRVANIVYYGVTSDKLRRYHDFKNLLIPKNIIKGTLEATKVLKDNKIDIIFSKGGYVAVPVILAASRMKIPIISHESDLSLGLANRIANRFSKIMCCNFKELATKLKNGEYTGSPVREGLLDGSKEEGLKILGFKRNLPIILIMGGSSGSVFLNEVIRKNLDNLLPKYNIVHSTGRKKINLNDYNDIEGYKQFEFINTDVLKHILKASDLIISRAGANVIFEYLALKKLHLLIPLSKRASRGDQILNAEIFVKEGFSEMITEEDIELSNSLFLKKIDSLFENKNKYIKKMNEYNKENPINKICDIIDKYSGINNKKEIEDKKSNKNIMQAVNNKVDNNRIKKVNELKDKIFNKISLNKK